MWFLTKQIRPNLELLNAGLDQQGSKQICNSDTDVLNLIEEKINSTDFKAILKDVEPFLLDANEKRFFNKETFLGLLKHP